MESINKIKVRIAQVKSELEDFEIDTEKHEASFLEMLDEEGPVDVAGLKFYPSQIWQELDPIALRCGLNDYVDSLDVTNDEDYKELEAELEELEAELEELGNLIDECDEENFAIYLLPDYFASYLINADCSGLRENEIKEIDEFIKDQKLGLCTGILHHESNFCAVNALNNLGGNCLRFIFERGK